MQSRSFLRLPGRSLPLERTVVMGVLNVTPDSFSDGGAWMDPDAAVLHGFRMIEEGAGILDVGGESTRPGADPVPEGEECERVLPVIERLAARTDIPISIDTRKPQVARRAIDAGAVIVNDTSGEEHDPEMDRVAVETHAGIIVMHSRGSPSTMRSMTTYGDVVAEVGAFLTARAASLLASGVQEDAVVLDPGFGFAKTPEQNLEMLRRLEELTSLPHPILVGTSRKSFIGSVLGAEVDDRLEGTAATVAVAVQAGASIIRVHDVGSMSRVVRRVEAIIGRSGLA